MNDSHWFEGFSDVPTTVTFRSCWPPIRQPECRLIISVHVSLLDSSPWHRSGGRIYFRMLANLLGTPREEQTLVANSCSSRMARLRCTSLASVEIQWALVCSKAARGARLVDVTKFDEQKLGTTRKNNASEFVYIPLGKVDTNFTWMTNLFYLSIICIRSSPL